MSRSQGKELQGYSPQGKTFRRILKRVTVESKLVRLTCLSRTVASLDLAMFSRSNARLNSLLLWSSNSRTLCSASASAWKVNGPQTETTLFKTEHKGFVEVAGFSK